MLKQLNITRVCHHHTTRAQLRSCINKHVLFSSAVMKLFASHINASVMPSAQLMHLVRSALMACYDLNTEHHQGSEGNEQQVICLSIALAFVLITNASGTTAGR